MMQTAWDLRLSCTLYLHTFEQCWQCPSNSYGSATHAPTVLHKPPQQIKRKNGMLQWTYRIYSHISRPAYKPTPIPMQKM